MRRKLRWNEQRYEFNVLERVMVGKMLRLWDFWMKEVDVAKAVSQTFH
jgi:hypothetical protein